MFIRQFFSAVGFPTRAAPQGELRAGKLWSKAKTTGGHASPGNAGKMSGMQCRNRGLRGLRGLDLSSTFSPLWMQASLGKTLEVVENLLTQLDAEEALYSPDMQA